MSFNVQTLKSATDDQIPSFLRSPQNGTTTAIRHNTIYEVILGMMEFDRL